MVDFTHRLAQAVRNASQHGIAGKMTVGVIDELEVVEVKNRELGPRMSEFTVYAKGVRIKSEEEES